MNNQQKIFGKLLEKRRKEMNLSKKELALKLGYSNISKGIRRVDSIEKGDAVEPIITKIMNIFNVTQEERTECEETQKQWVRSYIDSLPPIKPHIVLRAIPGIYIRKQIPQHLLENEMFMYAKNLSKKMNMKLCLVYSREKRYWINPNGVHTVGAEFGGEPRMMLRK